jgi:hypothetical protein
MVPALGVEIDLVTQRSPRWKRDTSNGYAEVKAMALR